MIINITSDWREVGVRLTGTTEGGDLPGATAKVPHADTVPRNWDCRKNYPGTKCKRTIVPGRRSVLVNMEFARYDNTEN